MSADRPATSFGDSNTVPLTPKETPTSAEFPQAVFETPKANQGSFDDLSGWTPRFAEEYSVFNNTPGKLRGTSGPFPKLPDSIQPSSSHKRLLSADSIAVEIASHANHYSPNSALPLPPVDPSRRLPSSPSAAGPFPSPVEADCPTGLQQRLGKKVRRGTLVHSPSQTVTPPPSARKSERRLAPKPHANSMQHDEYESEFVAGMPQQQNMLGGFVSAPIDMFGMPLSAPVTAPIFDESQNFWDPGMSGMDIDFSIPVANSFHGGTNHRPMESLDWGGTNEMFQETNVVPPKNQEIQPQKKERLLAPKPTLMPNIDTSMTEAPAFTQSFQVSTEDSFAPLNVGGVDPGLLLTRPPSSSMELAAFDPMTQPILMDSLPSPQLPPPPPAREPKRAQVRRSASTREVGKAKKDERTSPPILASSRPGLLRSASETRGRKPTSRAGASTSLAPSVRNGLPTNNRSASQGSRTSGRTSPLKIHQRLSSLSSIPEHGGSRTRTSVRFTIDSRGRARAETTVVMDEEQQTPTGRHQRREERRKEWESSEDESSSTDDEPIIIPSRNSSFALPESKAPSYIRPIHTSHRSFSDQSTSSLGIYYAGPISSQGDPDSDAETIMNIAVNHNNNRGDAMSELRKVRENRQRRVPILSTSNLPKSGAPFSASATVSSQSTDRGNQIRCVCNTTLSHINGDGYMVRCESCEMWLHGKCIKITRQTLPRVYICAFCANTPNAQGVRGRGAQRGVAGPIPRTSTTSPLARKSVRSFR